MKLHPVENIRTGLTFDDVLLVPKKTSIASRQEVELKTQLSRKLWLNIPLISANMDTVTEAPMAIALAQEGGLGIIHRFMSVEDEVREVMKVKRSQNVIIDDPYTISNTSTIGQAQQVMSEKGTSSLLVVNAASILVGIVTHRDMVFVGQTDQSISAIMTPREKLITGQPNIPIAEAQKLLYLNRIEKLPLVDERGQIKGLVTRRDIFKRQEFPLASKDARGHLLVGAAVGVKDDYFERAQALVKAGADVLVIDIAHGHSDVAINAAKRIKKEIDHVELIVGNVATAEGTEELIAAGADAVKVGVGPGSMCTTRIVTGSGVPQLTAIMDAVAAAQKHSVPIIADGGLRTSGDIVKALAAGATTVMAGGFFAGTDESPGRMITRHGQKVKVYQGSASMGSVEQRHRRLEDDDNEHFRSIVPEGVETTVPYRGSAHDVIHQLLGGLRSGLSYSGARTIAELHQNAEFIRMTSAGLGESIAHGARKTE